MQPAWVRDLLFSVVVTEGTGATFRPHWMCDCEPPAGAPWAPFWDVGACICEMRPVEATARATERGAAIPRLGRATAVLYRASHTWTTAEDASVRRSFHMADESVNIDELLTCGRTIARIAVRLLGAEGVEA